MDRGRRGGRVPRHQQNSFPIRFAEVDIEIPRNLWDKFEEMCPFFINKEVTLEAVPQSMHGYLRCTFRTRGDGKKLLGALSAAKMLVYAPLLKWNIAHGAEITPIHRTINYKPGKTFTWFVEQLTEACRTGDVEKSKTLLAEVFKLLGNSAYGKMIEAVERQTGTTINYWRKKLRFGPSRNQYKTG